MTPAAFKQARQTLGLTQQGLAEHIGMSLSIVGKWERGEVEIPRIVARYMAALMAGYRPDDWGK